MFYVRKRSTTQSSLYERVTHQACVLYEIITVIVAGCVDWSNKNVRGVVRGRGLNSTDEFQPDVPDCVSEDCANEAISNHNGPEWQRDDRLAADTVGYRGLILPGQ